MRENRPLQESRRAHGRAATLRRDDRAATALMEDLPSFLIVTLAIGIFLVSASKAVVAYKQSFDQSDLLEEAKAVVQYLRASPDLVRDANAPMGGYALTKVQALQAEATAGKSAQVLRKLSVREPAMVRILDTSAYRFDPPTTCAAGTLQCELFRAKIVNPALETSAQRVIVSSPVTLHVSAREERVGILEVTLWPTP